MTLQLRSIYYVKQVYVIPAALKSETHAVPHLQDTVKEFQVQLFTEIYPYTLFQPTTCTGISEVISVLKNTKTVGKILEPNPKGPFNIVKVRYVMVILTGIRNPSSVYTTSN